MVFMVVLNLTTGRDQTALDDILSVLAALAQAPLQGFAIRRQHEDADGIGQSLFDLLRALDVDVEQKVMSFLFRLTQESAGGAVVVAENVGILQKLIGPDHLLKFVMRNEVILLSVLFPAARRTCGVRNGKVEIVNQLK